MLNFSEHVKKHIPDWIQDQYPIFVDFMSAYYEWLSKQGNPVDIITNFKEYSDLDRSIDEFADKFKEEVIPYLPEKTSVDKRYYLKYIDDLFEAKGTEESFRLLFRIMYGQSIDIIYPRDNLFVPSSGNWVSNDVSIKTSANYPSSMYNGRKIEQRQYTESGSYVVTASANVDRAYSYSSGGFAVNELFLDGIWGEFVEHEDIYMVIDGKTYKEVVMPAITDVKIVNSGVSYPGNFKLDVDDTNAYFEREFTFEGSSVFDLKITHTFVEGDAKVYVNGVRNYNFIFDGSKVIITHVFEAGDVVTVRLPVTGLYVQIDEVDAAGSIRSVRVRDHGVGYSVAPDIKIDAVGDGNATVEVETGAYSRYRGYYSDTGGFASADRYLHDNYYYQNYSYVIKSEQSLSQYKDIVKKILHPAGFNMFGTIQIVGDLWNAPPETSATRWLIELTTKYVETFKTDNKGTSWLLEEHVREDLKVFEVGGAISGLHDGSFMGGDAADDRLVKLPSITLTGDFMMTFGWEVDIERTVRFMGQETSPDSYLMKISQNHSDSNSWIFTVAGKYKRIGTKIDLPDGEKVLVGIGRVGDVTTLYINGLAIDSTDDTDGDFIIETLYRGDGSYDNDTLFGNLVIHDYAGSKVYKYLNKDDEGRFLYNTATEKEYGPQLFPTGDFILETFDDPNNYTSIGSTTKEIVDGRLKVAVIDDTNPIWLARTSNDLTANLIAGKSYKITANIYSDENNASYSTADADNPRISLYDVTLAGTFGDVTNKRASVIEKGIEFVAPSTGKYELILVAPESGAVNGDIFYADYVYIQEVTAFPTVEVTGVNLIDGLAPSLLNGWVDNGDGTYSYDGTSATGSNLLHWGGLLPETGDVNATYVAEVEIISIASGYVNLGSGFDDAENASTVGTHKLIIQKTDTNANFNFRAALSDEVITTIRPISVKQVTHGCWYENGALMSMAEADAAREDIPKAIARGVKVKDYQFTPINKVVDKGYIKQVPDSTIQFETI